MDGEPTLLPQVWTGLALQQAQAPEAEAWAKALRGGDDEMRSSDPLVFGKPRAQPRAQAQRAPRKGGKVDHDFNSEVESWQAGLRGGEEPLVFSNPSYVKASKAPEKRSPSVPKRQPAPSVQPAARPPKMTPETPPKLKKPPETRHRVTSLPPCCS
eukprot:Skav200737  [mRNA]  locus=scaffold274:236232:238785:- [translate_table: standard]